MKYILALVLSLITVTSQAMPLPSGIASWYGPGFNGRRTASGEVFDQTKFTAAHRTLPFGTRVRVSSGDKTVTVKINDRGPYHRNRVIDLSKAAARELNLVQRGTGRVTLTLIEKPGS